MLVYRHIYLHLLWIHFFVIRYLCHLTLICSLVAFWVQRNGTCVNSTFYLLQCKCNTIDHFHRSQLWRRPPIYLFFPSVISHDFGVLHEPLDILAMIHPTNKIARFYFYIYFYVYLWRLSNDLWPLSRRSRVQIRARQGNLHKSVK